MNNPLPLPFQSNVNARFTIAHNFLTQKLIENSGVLKKSDIRMLQKVVNNYVAFSADESKYEIGDCDGVFFSYIMSVDKFKSKNVGNSRILFHNLLSIQYKIDVTQKNSNTFNKIILKHPDNVDLVNACNFAIKTGQKHIEKVGTTIPSKPRIVVANNGNVRLLVVFFMNESNKMCILFTGATNRLNCRPN